MHSQPLATCPQRFWGRCCGARSADLRGYAPTASCLRVYIRRDRRKLGALDFCGRWPRSLCNIFSMATISRRIPFRRAPAWISIRSIRSNVSSLAASVSAAMTSSSRPAFLRSTLTSFIASGSRRLQRTNRTNLSIWAGTLSRCKSASSSHGPPSEKALSSIVEGVTRPI